MCTEKKYNFLIVFKAVFIFKVELVIDNNDDDGDDGEYDNIFDRFDDDGNIFNNLEEHFN